MKSEEFQSNFETTVSSCIFESFGISILILLFVLGSKSPKLERKPFLESKKSNKDIESALSDQERNAYAQLVGECESLPPLTKLNSPCSNMSQSMACLPTNWSDQQDHFLQLSPPPAFPPPSIPVTNPTNHVNPPSSLKTTIPPSNPMENNPLPLPPKSLTLNR